jgi:hypothetical protein
MCYGGAGDPKPLIVGTWDANPPIVERWEFTADSRMTSSAGPETIRATYTFDGKTLTYKIVSKETTLSNGQIVNDPSLKGREVTVEVVALSKTELQVKHPLSPQPTVYTWISQAPQ